MLFSFYFGNWTVLEERNRRKQILCLLEKGNFSQRQIAERFGVSERTVKRDIAKSGRIKNASLFSS